MTSQEKTLRLARLVVEALKRQGLYVTTVESCTGGALADAITDVEGASEVFWGSLVTYSNETKIQFGVPRSIISKYTVYSAETAAAMASVGLNISSWTDIAVGITGSLGRVDPANAAASVIGEVYLCLRCRFVNLVRQRHLKLPANLSRQEAKSQIVQEALAMILEAVETRI